MNKKILVIDDDPSIVELLKLIFEKEGFITDTASDGPTGYDKAVTNQYDLVTMDFRMPNWNILESIGSLEVVRPEIKVIVISGYIDEEEKKAILNSPIVIDILKKPFNVADLVTMAKDHLPDD